MIETNKIGKAFCMLDPEKYSYMDVNNILWKIKDNEWVGKPVVRDPNYVGFRYIWEEDIIK